VHYQMAKSYVELKKYLKAAIHMTNAIKINKECYEYYKFRAEIYNIMGFKELSVEDLAIANSLIGK
jgi:Tfp pilus assembly protein PilF